MSDDGTTTPTEPALGRPGALAWAARDDVAPWLAAAFALVLYAASMGGDYVLDDHHPALLRHPAVSWGGAGVAALTYLLALLSKETVALLPAMVLWFTLLRWRIGGEPLGPALRGVALLGGVGLVYIGWRQ